MLANLAYAGKLVGLSEPPSMLPLAFIQPGGHHGEASTYRSGRDPQLRQYVLLIVIDGESLQLGIGIAISIPTAGAQAGAASRLVQALRDALFPFPWGVAERPRLPQRR